MSLKHNLILANQKPVPPKLSSDFFRPEKQTRSQFTAKQGNKDENSGLIRLRNELLRTMRRLAALESGGLYGNLDHWDL